MSEITVDLGGPVLMFPLGVQLPDCPTCHGQEVVPCEDPDCDDETHDFDGHWVDCSTCDATGVDPEACPECGWWLSDHGEVCR